MPLIVAIGWSLYNFKDAPVGSWPAREFVNVFGPTFFFVSWLGAQWFRVRKQQKVDADLGGIDTAVRQSIGKLELTSDHLVSYITGGNSFCYIAPPPSDSSRWVAMMVVHSGAFPLYDVRAVVIDLDRPLPKPFTDEHLFTSAPQIEVGDLVPGIAKALHLSADLAARQRIRLNLFFSARNGSFVQMLQCSRVAGQWESAFRVLRNEELLIEKVSDGFPKNADGAVEWDA